VVEESKKFWVSVNTDTGILAAGSGHNILQEEFMRLNAGSAKTKMTPLSFAVSGGGSWDFGGGMPKYQPANDGRYHTPPTASKVVQQGSVTSVLFRVVSSGDVSIGLFSTDMGEKHPRCSHVWEDTSQDCRECKFDCDDFFDKHLPRDISGRADPPLPDRRRKERPKNMIGRMTKVYNMGNEYWADTLLRYNGNGEPKAKVQELRQFKWCKYMDSVEGVPIVGSGREGKGHDHLIFAPGPIAPDAREWGGPGLVMNMEQFAYVHSNPTPIFNLPVDWTLLGKAETKQWVKKFGEDNSLFQRTFASAWSKVTSAGWDAKTMPSTGWSGAKLEECKSTKCTAKNGKFWCPVNVLTDRLQYLPKPKSLRLVLGECLEGAPNNSVSPGDCLLTGAHGVRGTIQCNSQTYHCCTERACEWEKWLKKHRKVDKQEGATCAFTKEEKKTEIKRTVKAWRKGPDGNGRNGAQKPEDLGMDYVKPMLEVDAQNDKHYETAKSWYLSAKANGTLPREFKCDWPHFNYQHCARNWHGPQIFEWLRVYDRKKHSPPWYRYGSENGPRNMHLETELHTEIFNGDTQMKKPE